MSVVISLSDPDHSEAIDQEVIRLLESGMLGRSRLLPDLFNYLVDRSRRNMPPREVEIAQDVFDRSAEAAIEDGISRVYVHRLRRRLETFYRDTPSPIQLEMPHGEYRLVARMRIDPVADVEPDELNPPASPPPEPAPQWFRKPRATALIALGVLAVAALATVITLKTMSMPAEGDFALWSSLRANGRPILVVEGDYYLFGERDGGGDVQRLIQDFKIRSHDDLQTYLLAHPDEAGKYGDVHVKYLPFSISYALMQLGPIFRDMKGLRIAPASALASGPLPTQNIVYLGLTSALGGVSSPLLAQSRFAFGSGFDEIIDHASGKTYQGRNDMLDNGSPERQYGLVSEFPGPNGNRYLVVAGTGELALSGLAQTISDPKMLAQLEDAAKTAPAFEALYAIDGQQGAVTAMSLIVVAPRNPGKIWSAESGSTAGPREIHGR